LIVNISSSKRGKGKETIPMLVGRRCKSPVLAGPAGDGPITHKPGGKLPLLSARPAVALPAV